MSTTPTSVPCVVESTYFPHLLLVPAGIIITILAFLRRRSFRNDLCGGRPGLVVPLDILGIDNDRQAIICVFGAATGSILGLIRNSVQGRNAWEIAFHGIGNTLEVAFLYYPYFGCLASYHRTIGALMGLPYAVVYFSVGMTTDLQECNNLETWKQYVFKMLPKIPTIICQLFILGKFVVVLYQEIRDYGICGVRLFSQNDEHASQQVKLIRPWLLNHVKDLINSKPRRQYSGIVFYLRKIYNPEKNFKFSTLTVSVVIICMILMYNISIQVVFLAGVYLNAINKVSTGQIGDVFRGVLACLVAGTVLAVLFCVVSFIRFMENHKNNMLRMFKGDKSFIPKNISASQFMIGKGLRYHSYQIGYFLWGFALLILLLFLICCAFYSLSFEYVQDKIVGFLKGGAVISGVALLTGLMLPLTSFTVFRDYNYSKDVISVNNRNVYLVFSYFWFFLGLPMGFLSAISRILKSMAVGALMLPRIDHSVMPDGFQQLDPGFNAYICYLHVQAAYRNPVLRVFCQILSDGTTKRKGQKWTCSAQARARWFLALTLDRNPQLVSERRPDVLAPELPVQYDPDVKIEVGKYGSDNVGLIQNE